MQCKEFTVNFGDFQQVKWCSLFYINKFCLDHIFYSRALLNEWLKAENDHHFKNCELIQELNDYLSFIGSIEPFEQVHITTRNSHNISLFFTLFIIAHLGRLQFNQQLPVKSSKDYLNPCLFVYGLITVFRQYHDNVRNLFITYLSEFIIKLVGINIR